MLEQLDSAGNTLWTWASPLFNKEVHGAKDIIPTKDGGWVIASALGWSRVTQQNSMKYFYDPYLFKLDANRNIVWEKDFHTGIQDISYFHKVIELEDSSLVAFGTKGIEYPDTTNPQYYILHGKIVKLTPNGNILWDREYQYLTTAFAEHEVHDAARTPDGGFLLCGEARGSGSGASQQGWLLKLDEHGCLVPGCHLVSGVLPPSATSSIELLLYPNPATQFLNVFYQSSEEGQELSFSIINVQGQTVQQYQSAAISGKTYMLEVETLPKGIYFLEVLLDGKLVETKEFVVGQ
jgi:hypothetical protein